MGRLAVDHGIDIIDNAFPVPFRNLADQEFLNTVAVDIVIGKADLFKRIALRIHADLVVHRAHILCFQALGIPFFRDCLNVFCEDIPVQVSTFCTAAVNENSAVGALHGL